MPIFSDPTKDSNAIDKLRRNSGKKYLNANLKLSFTSYLIFPLGYDSLMNAHMLPQVMHGSVGAFASGKGALNENRS